MEIILILIIILAMSLLGYVYYLKRDATYVKSLHDNRYYLVKKREDKQEAADMLAKIKENIIKVSEHCKENCTEAPYNDYMTTLHNKCKNIRISENINNGEYTSYSVEKGEELVFCLRSKLLNDEFHDINLLMYVVLHELAHIACPEYGHTPLFKDIFARITKIAIKEGLYKKIDFNKRPEEYCGMDITDSII